MLIIQQQTVDHWGYVYAAYLQIWSLIGECPHCSSQCKDELIVHVGGLVRECHCVGCGVEGYHLYKCDLSYCFLFLFVYFFTFIFMFFFFLKTDNFYTHNPTSPSSWASHWCDYPGSTRPGAVWLRQCPFSGIIHYFFPDERSVPLRAGLYRMRAWIPLWTGWLAVCIRRDEGSRELTDQRDLRIFDEVMNPSLSRSQSPSQWRFVLQA